MKMILIRPRLNPSFKQTQLLPVLSPELLSGRARAGGRSVEQRTAALCGCAGAGNDWQPPVLRPEHSAGAQMSPSLLGLGVLTAWMSRLLG